MSDRPALLGNSPIFERKTKLVRPTLPSYDEVSGQVREILESGVLSKGGYLRAFEEMVAEHLGVRHAVAVSSCTMGLLLTYRALGLKGEAVVPSYTFMATVSALELAGVRPAFADVDPATMNLDPRSARAAVTEETTAIIAVHNFGNPADIGGLQTLAEHYGVPLVFDAAQAFGSLYQGARVGAQGDAHVFSLTPTKLLVTGEGGIVATNRDDLAEKVRVGREYGNDGSYNSAFAGLNGRMPEINALLGLHGLPLLESAARHRNLVANLYRERLGRLPGVSFQEVSAGDRSSYNYFSVVVDADAFGLTRDELALALAAENIETRKYYDPPVHRQTAYQKYETTRPLHSTCLLASSVLCLPIWSDMATPVASEICSAVERVCAFAPEIKAKLEEMEKAVVS